MGSGGAPVAARAIRQAGRLATLVLAGSALGLQPVQTAELGAMSGTKVFISADKAAYAPGEPITLTLRVVNTTQRPVTVSFMTAQRFDIVVRAQEDREVWRWGATRMFAQVVGRETIPPAGELAYQAMVEKKLAPGVYTAQGLIPVQEGPFTASVVLRVEPP